MQPPAIHSADLTALILAGGRGARMGGADKGLQLFRGQPLAMHALTRLQGQTLPPAQLLISANRHRADYAALAGCGRAFSAGNTPPLSGICRSANTAGAAHHPELDNAPIAVLPDALPDHPGPLAGIAAGLAACQTPWLLVVPCDVPRLPLDLAARLGAATQRQRRLLAMACAAERPGAPCRPQPVFVLLHTALQPSLLAFLQAGERKAGQWMHAHQPALVPFDAPGDDPQAFCNINTLAQLHALETADETSGPA